MKTRSKRLDSLEKSMRDSFKEIADIKKALKPLKDFANEKEREKKQIQEKREKEETERVKQLELERLYNMVIGESMIFHMEDLYYDDITKVETTRVPGGWIFDGQFVPYSTEFKPKG